MWGSQSWLPPAFSRRLGSARLRTPPERSRLKAAAGTIARPATLPP